MNCKPLKKSKLFWLMLEGACIPLAALLTRLTAGSWWWGTVLPLAGLMLAWADAEERRAPMG